MCRFNPAIAVDSDEAIGLGGSKTREGFGNCGVIVSIAPAYPVSAARIAQGPAPP